MAHIGLSMRFLSTRPGCSHYGRKAVRFPAEKVQREPMKAVSKIRWIAAITIIPIIVLLSAGCSPHSETPGKPINSTLSVLSTETSQLSTRIAEQIEINESQQEAVSHLNTLMPSAIAFVIETPTPLPSRDNPTSYPVCTPPACAADEMYHCPGACPGGCGTTCATATHGKPAGSGQVWGKVCFPGENMAEMKLYFQEINTQQLLAVSLTDGQDSYQLEIPAGIYTAFAWLPKEELGGGYTQFVGCNQNVSGCTDHSLVHFLVRENHATTGIDICDWAVDAALFPTITGE